MRRAIAALPEMSTHRGHDSTVLRLARCCNVGLGCLLSWPALTMSFQAVPKTEAEQDARDLADCRPSSVVSAAAGAAAFSGVGCFMLALQLIMIPSRTVIANSALAMTVLFGAAFVVMA